MVPVLIPGDELVSVQRAAREIGITPRAVLFAIASGELAARNAAGRFVMRKCDVDAYRNARRRSTKEKREQKALRQAVGAAVGAQ